MQKEDKIHIIENRLNKIESLLFQIRILLVILIALSMVGFYGLSTLMGAVGTIGKVIFFAVIAILVCYLILLIIAKLLGINKKLSFKEEDLQRVLKEIESDKT